MKLFAQKNIILEHHKTMALFLCEDNINDIPAELGFIKNKIDLKYFTGKANEILFLPFSDNPSIIMCGLGKQPHVSPESLRNAAATVTGLCRDKSIKELHVVVPECNSLSEEDSLAAISEGLFLANYSFDKYKSKTSALKILLDKAYLYTKAKDASALLKNIEIICNNTLECRDLVNETSDACNAGTIAIVARQIAKNRGITAKFLTKQEIIKLKMGLLLAVNRGSKIDPQFIILKYKGNPKSKKYFAIIGKGITFDSGGLNLKPSGSIETMRDDMAGAAAALYTIKTAAELKLKKNLYAIVPTTDNMMTNDSYRPGDVFIAYNGTSVEIGNTDAEGRLILADALAYTEKNLKPDIIVDMATLTGACAVTFGEITAGYLTNNKELGALLDNASQSSGDKVWQLPLDDEYLENIKSDIADLNNIAADKKAGTIIGAIFLKNFLNDTKWAHIDIASTAWLSKQRGYRPKGATGFGVRLMIEVIKQWKD